MRTMGAMCKRYSDGGGIKFERGVRFYGWKANTREQALPRVKEGLLVRGMVNMVPSRALHEYFINKRLIADAAMLCLGMRPF